MALRSKLTAAIADAGKAERAAGALRTAAAKITDHEKTTRMPETRAPLIAQQDRRRVHCQKIFEAMSGLEEDEIGQF